MSEWRECRLEDLAASDDHALATGPFGSAISSRHFGDSGVPVIRGSNLSVDVGHRLIEDDFVFLPEQKAASFKRSVARRGDLVFTCWGTIGQVGFISSRSRYPAYVVSNKQMKMTPDPKTVDALFLYYLLSSPGMVGDVQGQAIGTSVPGFNLGQLRKLRVRVPQLSAQSQIAEILGSIDDLIENNRRRIALLERMAQAIYREWFVHFRYPSHENNQLVDAGQGSWPGGWTPVPIESLLTRHIGGGWGKEETDSQHTVPAFVIRGTDMPNVRQLDITRCPRRFHTPSNLATRTLVEEDIVMEVSGGGKEQSVGRSFMVSRELLKRFPEATICASFCKRMVVDRNRISPLLLALGLDEMYRSGAMDRYQVQSTGIKNLKFTAFLHEKKFAVPPRTLQDSFADCVEPLLMLATRIKQATIELSTCRDTLLPKLVTGAIDVSQLDLDALLVEPAA